MTSGDMAEARTVNTFRAQLREMLPELRQRYPIASFGLFGS
jgi:predicted nucleotidyltransferase